jgi:hypothetical protein
MTPTAHQTVDGHPVKLGDQVWFWNGWGSVRQRRLNKVDLGMWWASMTSKSIFSTERAALERAIEDERAALKRARQKVRSKLRSIERLTAQLGEERSQ